MIMIIFICVWRSSNNISDTKWLMMETECRSWLCCKYCFQSYFINSHCIGYALPILLIFFSQLVAVSVMLHWSDFSFADNLGVGYAVSISLLIVCFHPLKIVSISLFMCISVLTVLWISPIIPIQSSVIIFHYLIMRIRISGKPCCMNRTIRIVYILDLSGIFK